VDGGVGESRKEVTVVGAWPRSVTRWRRARPKAPEIQAIREGTRAGTRADTRSPPTLRGGGLARRSALGALHSLRRPGAEHSGWARGPGRAPGARSGS